VRNDDHFHASAQRLEARAVERRGRRAILLHKADAMLPSDYRASVLI
jgi:hypothetical protein